VELLEPSMRGDKQGGMTDDADEPLRQSIVSVHLETWSLNGFAFLNRQCKGLLIDAEKGYILTDRHAVLLPWTSANKTTVDLSRVGNFERSIGTSGKGVGVGRYSAICTFYNQEKVINFSQLTTSH